MQILQTILTILLFIVCLSTLVMIHEAGHLAMAKLFGVYCDDYSIGFGPALFHKKRKNAETYFSIRAILFGGFVSMASDEGELPSGVKVPKERSLKGIKKWKAALIMSAGIIMNVLLSILLLFIFNVAFPAKGLYSDVVSIEPGSKAESAQIVPFNPDTNEGDAFIVFSDPRADYQASGSAILYYDTDAVATFENGDAISVLATVQEAKVNFSNYSLDSLFEYYEHYTEYEEKEGTIAANFARPVTPDSTHNNSKLKSITLSFTMIHKEEGKFFICVGGYLRDADISELSYIDGKYYFDELDPNHEHPEYILANYSLSDYVQDIVLNVNTINGEKKLEAMGMSLYYLERYLPFGTRVSNTFRQFGQASSLIFTTIGGLFVGRGWEKVGSVVGAYAQ